MKRLCLLLLLLWPALCQAQKVVLPAEVRGSPGAWIVLVPESKEGGDVKWKTSSGLTLVPLDKLFPGQKSAGIVVQGDTGSYQVWAWNAKADVPSDLAICNVVIGTPTPPVPPVPPVPPIPPVPPVPPSPIPLDGLRVLIVYESSELGRMPAERESILFSKTIRDYLNAHCVKEGQQAGAWIVDKDADFSGLPKHWQDARARKMGTLPWIQISTGKSGYEGVLPGNVADTIALLQKYGETK